MKNTEMKNYKNIFKFSILAVALSLTVTSCGSFLDIEPKDRVTEDNFWNEKSDLEQMVAGVYVRMQQYDFVSRCIAWGELRGDNVDDAVTTKNNNKDVYEANISTLKYTNSYTRWAPFYAVINRCNTIITMAPVVNEKDPTYTIGEVKATIAELSAIRAMCYFYLVRTFKDVPYYTHAVTSEDQVQVLPASKGDSILNVCLKDLENVVGDAVETYPQTAIQGGGNGSRINKAGIYAIMADIALWIQDYDKAIQYSQNVINMKITDYKRHYQNSTSVVMFTRPTEDGKQYDSYPLVPTFSSKDFGFSFTQIFGQGDSFESIFELNFSNSAMAAGIGASNDAIGRFYGNHWTKDGNNGQGYLIVDGRLCSAILKGGLYNESASDKNQVQNDSRMYTSYTSSSKEFSDGLITKYVAMYANVNSELTSVRPSETLPGRSFLYNTRSDANWIFYRLTDVMLIQAEAMIMKGQYDDAFTLIWTVHRRSEMDYNKNPNETTSFSLLKPSDSDMMDLLMNERRMEFMFEGKRWFDLVRLAERSEDVTVARRIASKADKYATAGSGLLLSMEALYWPYNKDELKVNNLLHQKPYYANESGESFEKN